MKSNKPANKDRLEHILLCIDHIHSFAEGYSLEKFQEDLKVYYACLYQFSVIGEAIANIDQKILNRYNYPWYQVKSFRNFIMHEYHAVDARVVWDTIKLILPEFRDRIQEILANEFE
jgi:uncharacterized protein with HEPN domain